MFRPLCIIVGGFAIGLGLVLLLAPRAYLDLYVDSDTTAMAFAAQRLSPAIIGLGALLVLISGQPPGPFAARFAMVTALVWFAVAATGVFHYAMGVANVNILIAAVTEVILGLLFMIAGRRHRGP